jgi:hypothetical protein
MTTLPLADSELASLIDLLPVLDLSAETRIVQAFDRDYEAVLAGALAS